MALSHWRAVFQHGGEQLPTVEKNGVCRHVNTPMLKSVSERGGFVQKVANESYLRCDTR
jgi:hypothetical protein